MTDDEFTEADFAAALLAVGPPPVLPVVSDPVMGMLTGGNKETGDWYQNKFTPYLIERYDLWEATNMLYRFEVLFAAWINKEAGYGDYEALLGTLREAQALRVVLLKYRDAGWTPKPVQVMREVRKLVASQGEDEVNRAGVDYSG